MYDPTSPHAQFSPKMSPAQIKTNYVVFGTAEAINHVAMNSLGQGKHTVVKFKQQTVDPSVTSSYGTIYAKMAIQASGNAINLFYRTIQFIPGVPNTPQQMTFNIVTLTGYSGGTGPAPVYTNSQQSFSFGGFIIYFGLVVPGSLGGGLNGFNVAPSGSNIPIPSKLVSGRVVARVAPNETSYPLNLVGTNVVLFGSALPATLNYFIIGLV